MSNTPIHESSPIRSLPKITEVQSPFQEASSYTLLGLSKALLFRRGNSFVRSHEMLPHL
jgi:hypothetical protein